MRIFISYAREDDDFALRFARDVRDRGADIWVDRLDIPPGAPWDTAVEAALKACPVFLIILSPRSVASENVLDEVSFALGKGKKIVPVMYETCELPMRLARLQYVDFTADGYEASLAACVTHVNTLFGKDDSFGAAGTPPKPQGSRERPPESTTVVRGQSGERLDGMRFLWVDDSPRNNRYERKTLEELGAEVHLAMDTDDALIIAAEISFDLVVSDMGRGLDRRAGLTLLSKLRSVKVDVPFVIFAGTNAPKYKDEALRSGAAGCTNNPYELLDLILSAVSRARSPS